jgi:hypothetical protein
VRFKRGDLVTTKPGVCPGGRFCVPVEAVGVMQIHGRQRHAVRVCGLPYYEDELILEMPWAE